MLFLVLTSHLLSLQLKSLSFDEINPRETINDFQFSCSDSVTPPPFLPLFFPMFPLIISVSCTHLISQYLLIYLVLCNLLMLGLCLTQPACLMRYMYKSIFLLSSFHSAVSSRYFVIPCSKVLRIDETD